MSDKVRWGIISTAGIAEKSFIPAARENNRGEIVAVASRSRDKADAFAKKPGIPTVLDDYTALLESDAIDAVYNPLPNTMHAEWTVAAAESGKHIFCEKPLAMSVDEVNTMVDACEKNSVQLVEAFVFLFHAQTLKLQALLDEGVIGDIVSTHAYFNFRIQRPSDNIRLNKDLGGGGYPITFTRFVYGEEPLSLQAASFIDPDHGVDTRVSAIVKFSGNRHEIIQQSIDAPGDPGAAIYGEKGSIQIPQPYHPRSGAHLIGEDRFPFEDDRHPFTPAVEHFHEVLLDGKSLAVPATQAAGTLAIVDAIQRSSEQGVRISLQD